MQTTRISQNAFIALNSRFKSNRVLLEKDLLLFKVRPNLYYDNRRPPQNTTPDSNFYEYNVEHLTNLGFYLPEKPPIKSSNENYYEPCQRVLESKSLILNNKNLMQDRSLTDIVTPVENFNSHVKDSFEKVTEN